MRLRKDHLAARMEDSAFKAAYDELEVDFKIAQTLLEYRSEHNLTQAELAKLIEINRSDLSKIESADANPTLKTLKKIARALETSLQINFEPYKTVVSKVISNAKVISFSGKKIANDNGTKQASYSISLENQKNIDSGSNHKIEKEPALA